MKRNILLLILFAVIFTLFADRIDDIIQNSNIDVDLEDASALNLHTRVTLDVEEDFTYQRNTFYIKKILSYKGKKRYSDVKISYYPEYESIKINECFSVDREGNRIAVPENHIYDLDDQMSVFSPEFINRREMIINFPQVEPGYYIVIDYTITNTRKRPVSGIEHLQESNPFVDKEFTITFPHSLKLKASYKKDKSVNHKEDIRGIKHIRTWSVQNMPLIKKEENQPSYLIIGSPIIYSFYDSWQENASLKLSKLRPDSIPEFIPEIIEDLMKNDDSEDEKLLIIYKYMAKQFISKHSLINEIDFTPLSLEKIFAQKYGSERDLVALFLAFAKAAKIEEIYPALILEEKNRSLKEQISIAVDDFIMGLVIFKNGKLYIPGSDKIPYGYAGTNGANILAGYDNIKISEYKSQLEDKESYSYKYFLTDEQVLEEIKAELTGSLNLEMRYRYMHETEEKRKIWFNNSLNIQSAKLISGPDFHNFDKIDENLRFDYTLQYSDLIVKQDKFTYFKIDKPKIKLNVAKIEREYDYQIFSTVNRNENTTIKLYDKYKILNPPAEYSVEFTFNGKKAYYKYQTTLDNKEILIKRELFIPTGIVSKEDYPKFREFILSVQNSMNSMVFLK